MDVWEFVSGSELAALGSIIVIDIVMSGDNAIIIGMAAAGLPAELRKRAIIIGIGTATVLRILFAIIALHLLAIIGLTLAGGLVLLWVCWRMWLDLREHERARREADGLPKAGHANPATVRQPKTLGRALITIVFADVSMSLDNVLAVAGAAKNNVAILVFGLVLSITLMAVASNYIAKLLNRHHWIAYFGLAVVGYVAVDMIWRGSHEVISAASAGLM